jgi:hypothetical protein
METETHTVAIAGCNRCNDLTLSRVRALFRVCVCMCVCVRERARASEREGGREGREGGREALEGQGKAMRVCYRRYKMCVCVCVCARARAQGRTVGAPRAGGGEAASCGIEWYKHKRWSKG